MCVVWLFVWGTTPPLSPSPCQRINPSRLTENMSTLDGSTEIAPDKIVKRHLKLAEVNWFRPPPCGDSVSEWKVCVLPTYITPTFPTSQKNFYIAKNSSLCFKIYVVVIYQEKVAVRL